MAKIMAVNAGSSSIKFQLLEMPEEKVIASGVMERIGLAEGIFTLKYNGKKEETNPVLPTHAEGVQLLLETLLNKGIVKSLDEISGVGHRVVLGGECFMDSKLVDGPDGTVVKKIAELADLAPLHNPAAILGIEACRKVVPDMKMVAVFDTAFHQSIPKSRYIYPIPYKYYENYGVRKYGFHGTSHKYVAYRVAEMLEKDVKDLKIVNCHLGQGASICAIQNGESVETSMGLTPLGGIPMGTRSGDLDPSILTYLMKKENLTIEQIEDILNKKSGVYGISRVSTDFRDIEFETLSGGTHAKLSLDVFCYLIAGYIMKCAVAMGGIDVLTFTAGVGEKSPYCREHICKNLEFLGAKLDLNKNEVKGEEAIISRNDSSIQICVVPTNEELMIARETMNLIF